MLGKLFLEASTGVQQVEIKLGDGLMYSLLGVCVVFAMLLALMVVIKIMGVINESVTKPAPKAETPVAPTPAPAPAPSSVKVEAKKEEEAPALRMPAKTAAMLIATVADAMGCEPEELRFKSIKRVPTGGKIVDGMEITGADEKTAAMVMAIVADEMGCEPDELVFNSIKRV